jgi:crossover junction endodeoxyribonuclease RuvC
VRAIVREAGPPGGLVVLGVDPGTVRTGWGVVRRAGPRLAGIAAGTIRANEREPLAERLKEIHEALAEVILTYRPGVMAVEDIFYARFARAALQLGQARGVALLAGAEAGLAVAGYPPAVVKRAVAGRGHAEKKQLARVVAAILGWRTLSEPDAADALAVAITHARAAAARIPAARPRGGRGRRGRGRWR